MLSLPARSHYGFTLIELVVAVTVISILVLTGAPAFNSWVANAQVRTVADGIANGLHLAQAEASRRNHSVKFVLTNDATLTATSTYSSTGTKWVIVTVPKIATSTGIESAEMIQGSSLGNVASSVAIVGPANALTFNSFGYVSGASAVNTFNVTRTGSADHPLNVTVSVGGQIRICEFNKSIANTPEGC